MWAYHSLHLTVVVPWYTTTRVFCASLAPQARVHAWSTRMTCMLAQFVQGTEKNPASMQGLFSKIYPRVVRNTLPTDMLTLNRVLLVVSAWNVAFGASNGAGLWIEFD